MERKIAPIPWVDLHTHTLAKHQEDEIRLLSLNLSAGMTFPEEQGTYYSLGLHPWYIAELGEEALGRLEDHLDREPRIIALGEAGLDRRCDTDFSLQLHLFEEQIKISERRALPLIIHLVGAQDALLRLHKKYVPKSPWIIHGFRGKVSTARQLLDKGIYLSFGEHYQGESLVLAHSMDLAFLETDDQASLLIRTVYEQASTTLEIEVEDLAKSIWERVQRVFRGHIGW